MTDFQIRNDISRKATDAWIEYCIENGIHYCHTGYEKWKCSNGFLKAMKENIILKEYPYPLWSKIRYIPDFFIITPLSAGHFIDAKGGNGKTIEKDAYEFYMELAGKNINVSLAKLKNSILSLSGITDVKINDQIKTKMYYGVPVVCNKWMFARLLKKEENGEQLYKDWQEKTGGSGTPFGEIINFSEFERLKTIINEKDEYEINDIPNSNYMYPNIKRISDKFIDFCKETKREYAFCGADNLSRSESFLPALRKSKDRSCRMIKFFPDLMVVKPDSSSGSLIKFLGSDLKIERDAFDFYTDLNCMGLNITFVALLEDSLCACPIQTANIKDLGEVYNTAPVFEHRWAEPKKLKGADFSQWMEKNKSDESFGFIENKCFQKLM